MLVSLVLFYCDTSRSLGFMAFGCLFFVVHLWLFFPACGIALARLQIGPCGMLLHRASFFPCNEVPPYGVSLFRRIIIINLTPKSSRGQKASLCVDWSISNSVFILFPCWASNRAYWALKSRFFFEITSLVKIKQTFCLALLGVNNVWHKVNKRLYGSWKLTS